MPHLLANERREKANSAKDQTVRKSARLDLAHKWRSNEELLARLLELNLARASRET
jgi:hypothetical protein